MKLTILLKLLLKNPLPEIIPLLLLLPVAPNQEWMIVVPVLIALQREIIQLEVLQSKDAIIVVKLVMSVLIANNLKSVKLATLVVIAAI